MPDCQVPLKFFESRPWAYLRELRGHDEQSVKGIGTPDAIRLLDRVLVATAGHCVEPGMAKQLVTTDRDRLLGRIFINTYGPRIESTILCDSCKAKFDMDFSLEGLITFIEETPCESDVAKDPKGFYRLSDGRVFRLPTGEDECAILGMPPVDAERAVLGRCVVEGDPSEDPGAVQKAVKNLAPVLDLDLNAGCPECESTQSVHFDIQYYLLSALKQEWRQLLVEVHQLARAYHWNLNEILELPRSVRKTYVSLVESESDAVRRRWS